MKSKEHTDPLIRVIDDDPQMLKAIGFFLDCEGYRYSLFSDALIFLEEDDGEEPGCIITDIKMPNLDGIELQEKLNKKFCQLPILFITGHGELETAIRVFKAGAVDFLQKPIEAKELLEAVKRALIIARTAKPNTPQAIFASLSAREKQVLRDVSQGLSNKLISEHLGITVRTVEFHRLAGLKKLGIKSEELADFFIQLKK